MTSPEIIKSISKNKFTLILKSDDNNIKCELSKISGDQILSQRFIANPHQFKFINNKIEEMIGNLLKAEKEITLHGKPH